jgi:antitoxin CcdA
MNRPLKRDGLKRATNVSLDAELVNEAKRLGINLSQACETGLALQVRAAAEERWKQENGAAIASSNAYVLQHGLPLARYRQF